MERLDELFEYGAAKSYGSQEISMCAHMLRTAALAERDNAPDSLVAAALLHDIGHFFVDYAPGYEDARHAAMLDAGRDKRHEVAGASFLKAYFGPEITEPIRLHVSAKRYLSAIDPNYHNRLAATTRYTLMLQGGPMTAVEVAKYLRNPYGEASARLRRYDDESLSSQTPIQPFSYYRPLLVAEMTDSSSE
ncbi:MAG: HD domain-containing protein [Pseudomonadota bacterium]